MAHVQSITLVPSLIWQPSTNKATLYIEEWMMAALSPSVVISLTTGGLLHTTHILHGSMYDNKSCQIPVQVCVQRAWWSNDADPVIWWPAQWNRQLYCWPLCFSSRGLLAHTLLPYARHVPHHHTPCSTLGELAACCLQWSRCRWRCWQFGECPCRQSRQTHHP